MPDRGVRLPACARNARPDHIGDRIKFRISVMTGVWTEGDHRDWAAIRAWASSLRPLLL